MREYRYITLREDPELKKEASRWFHSKWGVPEEAYLECMENFLDQKTEYGWEFFCMTQGDGEPDMTRMYIHKG